MYEIPRYEIVALNGAGARIVVEDTRERDTIVVSVYGPNYQWDKAASCRLGLREILALVNVFTKTYPALEVRRLGEEEKP